MSAREALARAQAELMRALELGAPVPEGFDAGRVRAAAEALLDKRRRGVQRAWPQLARALGEDFAREFEAWAREHPPRQLEPHAGGEGYRFARALEAAGSLPGEAAREVLGFTLRWRLTAGGDVVARRGLVLRVLRLGGRWTVGARLPGGRVSLRRLTWGR